MVCASDKAPVLPYVELSEPGPDAQGMPVRRVAWGLGHSDGMSARSMQRLHRFPLTDTLARSRARKSVMNRVLPVAREAIRSDGADVIYASAPPPEALLIAERLGREFSRPVVADLRDPWTYYPWSRYRHLLDFLLERRVERLALARASRVIVTTEALRQLLIGRLGIPGKNVIVIPNGYDEEDFGSADAAPAATGGKFTIAYTGLLNTPAAPQPRLKGLAKRLTWLDYRPVELDTSTRSPQWFFAAVEAMLRREPELADQITIVFVGSYGRRVMDVLDAFPWRQCIEVRSAVSHEEALRVCRSADLCLLLQIHCRIAGEDCALQVPGKLYDYLRSGTRILALVQPGDAQEIIEKLEAGTVVAPRDVAGIEAALRAEMDGWRRGETRREVPAAADLARYDRRNLAGELAAVLRGVQ